MGFNTKTKKDWIKLAIVNTVSEGSYFWHWNPPKSC